METVSKQSTKWYSNPYVFDCVVADEPLVAKVVAEIKNPCHYVFCRGIQQQGNSHCHFVTSVEGGWIADKGLNQYEVPIERKMDRFLSEFYLEDKCA